MEKTEHDHRLLSSCHDHNRALALRVSAYQIKELVAVSL
jgi:hypothetical protein